MRKIKIVALAILMTSMRATASQDARSCCSSSGKIRQIKLLAHNIKNSINEINDQVSEFECTPADMASLMDNIASISSALDTVTGIGISNCCSDVDHILSFVISIDSRADTVNPNCCDLVAESIERASTFDSLIDSIQSGPTCCSLVDRMLSAVEALESVVAGVDSNVGCATIPIFTSTTISESGSYCLANTLNPGFIVITAGNVTLNLNGNAVIMDESLGIFLDVPIGIRVSGPGNVIIKNGFIDAQAMPVFGIALFVSTSHVIIKDVQVIGNFSSEEQSRNSLVEGIILEGVNGESFFTIHDIFVDRVTVDRCLLGIGTQEVHNCTIKNSGFNENKFNGAVLLVSPFNRIDNCIFNGNGNTSTGIAITGGSNVSGGNNLVVNCTAEGNTVGFGLNTSTQFSDGPTIGNALIDCTAQSNSDAGFDVISDEQTLQLIKRCIATGNDVGFRNTTCSIIEYIANVAQDNTTNYDVLTNPTFNTPVDPTIVDPASYWLNLTLP